MNSLFNVLWLFFHYVLLLPIFWYFSSLSVLFVLFSRSCWGYKMTQRLGIYAITPEIPDWTCKVQVVDICKPGEGSHHKIKYLNMICNIENFGFFIFKICRCSKTYSSIIQELKRSFLPLQLLGDILLYCSDYVAMTRSVSSRGNLRSLLSLCKPCSVTEELIDGFRDGELLFVL
ncbi:uncharacterized protein LOC132635098 isoform X2 [Lycium barbarum]|uniref:uncharacterized protein LOC132635098 isoform X2 n=1 Tax=Lycium barbarum TaxID=112863 RepID=UPI00293E451F|nr:uncharacterized protein LOC132635098 isoform X2 [Lycium barbarum]